MGELAVLRIALAPASTIEFVGRALADIEGVTLRFDVDACAYRTGYARAMQSKLDVAKVWLAIHGGAFLARVHDLMKPADDRLIRDQLVIMILAIPNAPKEVDLRGYGYQLADHVSSHRPSIFATLSACYLLPEESDFLPGPHKTLQAIKREESRIRRLLRLLEELPLRIRETEDGLQRHAREKEEVTKAHARVASEWNGRVPVQYRGLWADAPKPARLEAPPRPAETERMARRG